MERIIAGRRVFPNWGAIHPDFGRLHGPLEFKKDIFAFPSIRHEKRAPIPSHLAPLLCESTQIGRKNLVGVRQRDRFPGLVIKCRVHWRGGHFAKVKAPDGIDIDAGACVCGLANDGCEKTQIKAEKFHSIWIGNNQNRADLAEPRVLDLYPSYRRNTQEESLNGIVVRALQHHGH